LANLTEQQIFDAAVYELATTDPVMGGPGGVDNRPHQNLANRTAWLKQQVDALIAAGGSAADITAAINAHLAAADPHAQYTTNAEVNALIDSRPLKRTNMPQGLQRVSTNLPNDYPLQTWSDALEDGHYNVGLTTPQAGLPADWYYIDVQRYDTDLSTYQYRTITARSFGSSGPANIMYMSSNHLGVWTPFQRITKDADFVNSLGANGYQKLPNGLIIQWGRAPVNGNNAFPIAFPNACVSISCSQNSRGSYIAFATVVNKSTFNASAVFPNISLGVPLASYTWMAIGY